MMLKSTFFEMGKTKTFGDIDIESFGGQSRCCCPQFYRFMKDGKSFVMLTDTGYVSDRLAGNRRGCGWLSD